MTRRGGGGIPWVEATGGGGGFLSVDPPTEQSFTKCSPLVNCCFWQVHKDGTDTLQFSSSWLRG